jgi:1,2-diacylglycerol 3-alpha-glucosyltransferase/glucuronosyltransferase
MRILVATDAAPPQINGVVRTYERLAIEAGRWGAEIVFLTPHDFKTLPCPVYSGIRLALWDSRTIAARIEAHAPRYIHIATEGPVGLMARSYCLARGIPFTTCFHTRFPEYAAAMLGVPASASYTLLRRFHNASNGTMVATSSLSEELSDRGFERLMPWTRGVDTDRFRPRKVRLFGPGPVFLSVGRVSKEKNLEAFLDLDLPGRKVVVGEGPLLGTLSRRYPHVLFTGAKQGEELAACYASADVFVFPSRTDTFGLVLLEAMASGLPVAAFPVTGPGDVVAHGTSGMLDDDLARAATQALRIAPAAAREHALQFSWAGSAKQFVSNIVDACGGLSAARASQVPYLPMRQAFADSYGSRRLAAI